MNLNLSEPLQKVISGLEDSFEDAFEEVNQYRGDTIVRVRASSIVDICRYLKEEHRFIYLVDIFGTDRFTTEERFEVIYNLISLRDRVRLFIKTRLPEKDPTIASVTGVWKAANWYEREVYDMFGVHFEEHPDLRRIFMPEDFDYHPLRKEFPLLGVPGSIQLPSSTPDPEE